MTIYILYRIRGVHMTDRGYGFNTALLHSADDDNPYGATLAPIYQSSSFKQADAETLEKIFNNKAMGFSYTRINNPTIEAFEKRVNKLEGGMSSVACASGMAAIFNAMVNILQAGDEIVAAAGLYGGTVELFDDLEGLGITTRYVLDNEPSDYEALINDKTKLIFAETIGNPKLDVTDIEAVAKLAHSHNIPLIIDNTVATPYLVRPIGLGADIVVNSSSKYMNGHSNSISGILTWSGKFAWDYERYPGLKPYRKFGAMSYIVKLRNGLFRNTGGCLSPQNAFYNTLGLETLGIRMERECGNALELAVFLRDEMKLDVNYPGLPDSKYHEVAGRLLEHGYGAIITVRAGSKERAFKIINALKIPYILANIGDTKTLVIHPASTIAAHLSDEEKELSGVYDDLIRISLGIEDIEDLKEDFRQAIQSTEG